MKKFLSLLLVTALLLGMPLSAMALDNDDPEYPEVKIDDIESFTLTAAELTKGYEIAPVGYVAFDNEETGKLLTLTSVLQKLVGSTWTDVTGTLTESEATLGTNSVGSTVLTGYNSAEGSLLAFTKARITKTGSYRFLVKAVFDGASDNVDIAVDARERFTVSLDNTADRDLLLLDMDDLEITQNELEDGKSIKLEGFVLFDANSKSEGMLEKLTLRIRSVGGKWVVLSAETLDFSDDPLDSVNLDFDGDSIINATGYRFTFKDLSTDIDLDIDEFGVYQFKVTAEFTGNKSNESDTTELTLTEKSTSLDEDSDMPGNGPGKRRGNGNGHAYGLGNDRKAAPAYAAQYLKMAGVKHNFLYGTDGEKKVGNYISFIARSMHADIDWGSFDSEDLEDFLSAFAVYLDNEYDIQVELDGTSEGYDFYFKD